MICEHNSFFINASYLGVKEVSPVSEFTAIRHSISSISSIVMPGPATAINIDSLVHKHSDYNTINGEW